MPARYKRSSDGQLTHRKVMEEHLGRKLLPTEQVHHINGDRFDNRIENLQVVTQEEHDLIHKWKYPKTRICVICGKEFEPYESKRKTAKVCSPKCKHALDIINSAKRKRPIIQKTLDGDVIKIWECGMDVQRELGFFSSNIVKCCKHIIHSYKGYKWEYKDN